MALNLSQPGLQGDKLRGLGGQRPHALSSGPCEKKQLARRVKTLCVQEILAAFNAGQLDAATAAERLMVSRTRLHERRHLWLTDKNSFALEPSGGDHRPDWPEPARAFPADFLPHCQPLHFALLADELARRFDFQRSRAAVAAHVRQHFPDALPTPKRGPQPRRRWPGAALGELWPHDSSPHPWWPADTCPTLILPLDDHSRKILAGTFAPSDTTWSHFPHLRGPVEQHGPPAGLYTDGRSLFGHRSPANRLDTHPQFQRAFTAPGTAHRVAPDAQAKGKIERRFDTFQKRLVSLLAYEKTADFQNANALLQTPIDWRNQHQICRTTGLTPTAAWDLALKERRNHHRPIPAVPLLDLHLALYHQRRLNADYPPDFLGKNWPVTPVARKTVTVAHHRL